MTTEQPRKPWDFDDEMRSRKADVVTYEELYASAMQKHVEASRTLVELYDELEEVRGRLNFILQHPDKMRAAIKRMHALAKENS